VEPITLLKTAKTFCILIAVQDFNYVLKNEILFPFQLVPKRYVRTKLHENSHSY